MTRARTANWKAARSSTSSMRANQPMQRGLLPQGQDDHGTDRCGELGRPGTGQGAKRQHRDRRGFGRALDRLGAAAGRHQVRRDRQGRPAREQDSGGKLRVALDQEPGRAANDAQQEKRPDSSEPGVRPRGVARPFPFDSDNESDQRRHRQIHPVHVTS